MHTKIKEYTKFTQSTAIYPETAKVTYPAFLLIEELVELHDAATQDLADKFDKGIISAYPSNPVLKEAGDVLWGLIRFLDDQGMVDQVFSFEYDASDSLNSLSLTNLLGLIAQYMAKNLRDKKCKVSGVSIAHAVVSAVNYELCVRYHLEGDTEFFSEIIEDAMTMNMDKLSSRKSRGKIKGSGDDR